MSKTEASIEDPYGLPTGVEKEEESSEENPEGFPHTQPNKLLKEAPEYAPYGTETAQPQHVAESLQDPEVTLATVMNEMKTVKDECS